MPIGKYLDIGRKPAPIGTQSECGSFKRSSIYHPELKDPRGLKHDLDAAWIAQEQQKPNQVWELGHRAEILAASPLLSQSDRGAILQRIERAPGASQQLVIGR